MFIGVNYIGTLAKFTRTLHKPRKGSFTLHAIPYTCSLHFDESQKNENHSLNESNKHEIFTIASINAEQKISRYVFKL